MAPFGCSALVRASVASAASPVAALPKTHRLRSLNGLKDWSAGVEFAGEAGWIWRELGLGLALAADGANFAANSLKAAW